MIVMMAMIFFFINSTSERDQVQFNYSINETNKTKAVDSKWRFVNKKLNGESSVPLIWGKTASGLKSEFHFQWINQNQGIGQIEVELSQLSFVEGGWDFEWILPRGTNLFSGELSGAINQIKFKSKTRLSISIQNLDSQLNQNTILRLKSQSLQKVLKVVVIPSHPEQTQEHFQKMAFIKKQEINLQTHSYKKSSVNRLRGIHF